MSRNNVEILTLKIRYKLVFGGYLGSGDLTDSDNCLLFVLIILHLFVNNVKHLEFVLKR